MRIVGLTGSIGMGKTTAARMLRRMRVPVCDSDGIVHRLFGRGGAAVPVIARHFPAAVRDGQVDRVMLGASVLGDRPALAKLESLIHPLVRQAQQRFLRAAARRRERLAVLDIPLLFETAADRRVDAVIVVSAPGWMQRWRVLRRPGMTAAKLASILARQTPDADKRQRADVVIPTGLGLAVTRRVLQKTIRIQRHAAGGHWPPRWVWENT